jgi:catechol 2,3-dioxygenase-like lactoylglutathione lyase family enzyme
MEHVGLSVSDIERSIAFYCAHFGFRVVRKIEGNDLLGKVVGMPGCKATIVHLVKGSFMLEIFQYFDPEGKAIPADRKQADIGFSHIGFSSSDVRRDYRILRDAGVKFFSEPVEFREDVWICYFSGPDGEVIEIRESGNL